MNDVGDQHIKSEDSLKLGLCCAFIGERIKFRSTTVKSVGAMKHFKALEKISKICLDNSEALIKSLEFCAANHIGCFRVNSQILPIKTHPEYGYNISELPEHKHIIKRFKECGKYAKDNNIRISFHPDQFVVLNSPDPEIVKRSIAELEYQTEVAEWVGADVINIHGGGAYGDKSLALSRFAQNLNHLSNRARHRLTIENDDRIYTPHDLLSLCKSESIPLVYDVHHHRCNRDNLTVEEATEKSIGTWDRLPMFHISSPIEGWGGPNPRTHHDYINFQDFPVCWKNLNVTIEVEAKAKELAVLKLQDELLNN